VIAGQGTATKELIEEVGQLDALSFVWAVAACSQDPLWRPDICLLTASSMVLNLRRVTMVNSRFVAEKLFISIRPKTIC
jgi:hypothetical protein